MADLPYNCARRITCAAAFDILELAIGPTSVWSYECLQKAVDQEDAHTLHIALSLRVQSS